MTDSPRKTHDPYRFFLDDRKALRVRVFEAAFLREGDFALRFGAGFLTFRPGR